ncbi:UvrABC system protein A [compost metagenome]
MGKKDQSHIVIRGARENNLKNISLKVPKKKITVFTGVSGSGKSSLVFDTIAAESQRQLNETFDSFIRHRLPHYGQPEADSVENLSVAIIIDQKQIGGNARSTVGTITDVYTLLRLLFSRMGEPWVGESSVFSFNNPKGMCAVCEGIGKINSLNIDRLIDKEKSLNEGAIVFPSFQPGGWRWMRYVYSGFFDNDKKLKDYTKKEWDTLLYADGIKPPNPHRDFPKTSPYEGIVPRFERTFFKRETKEIRGKSKKIYDYVVTPAKCPACKGTRLNDVILNCKIKNKNIADCAAMQIDDLIDFIKTLKLQAVQNVINAIKERLIHLDDIGLGYFSLDRETSTLSGGESQRVKMVKHLGSSLADIAYIFDEPSVGLHPGDVDRLNRLVFNLRDNGNTILIVEHDPDVIAIAEHIVDMGPFAGKKGGEIVFEGTLAGLKRSGTLTGKYLSHKKIIKKANRKPSGFIELKDISVNNLKNVSVNIPTSIMTVITGVAGSGKSSLINQALLQKFPDILAIDQSALRGSKRSNIATYTGIFDSIRKLFATANKVSSSLFSFNSEGACSECKGLGKIYTDLAFMDTVVTTCEICKGTGYKNEILNYKLRNKNISEVLKLTIAEALDFFDEKNISHILEELIKVGLDYMSLGQPLNTLSGGERQRVKLSSQLQNTGQVYVFDEPTTGLHMSDVFRLAKILDSLVNNGSTVIVIEHNLDIISMADWIIDIGPGAGKNGGKIVFEGIPSDILESKDSITGQYLKKYITEH